MAIGCWIRDMALMKNGIDIEYTKASIDAMFVVRPERSVTENNIKGYRTDLFGIVLGSPNESLQMAQNRQMKKDVQEHGWILWAPPPPKRDF